MPRKNLGKLKRYRRSFYTGPQLLLKAGAWLAAAAVLFGVGYAFTGLGARLHAASQAASSSEGPVTASSAPQAASEPAAATPEPMPLSPAAADGLWAFASLSALEDAGAAAQRYAEAGVQYVVVPLKDASGYLYYQSAAAIGARSVAATTIDAAAVAQALTAAGLTPVASVYAFQDPLAPYADRTAGIHYRDTEYFWLDDEQEAGGKPWLDPWSDTAVGYISEVLGEAADMGYKAVLLSALQYPDKATENCGYAGGGTATAQRLAELTALWSKGLAERGAVLWLEMPLAVAASTEPVVRLGGTMPALQAENLVFTLPGEITEETQNALAAATQAAREAGAQHVAARSGETAAAQ